MRFIAIFLLLVPIAAARPWTPEDPCPINIKTVVSSDLCDYGTCSPESNMSTMGAVHAALLKCSNITALDIRVTGLGCSRWPDRWNFPFNRFGGDVYPRLESVRLEGYDFGGGRQRDAIGMKEWGRNVWKWIGGGNGHLSWFFGDQWMKSNLQLWLDAMDWSAVSEFALIDDIHFSDEMLEKLPSHLHNLRRLETTNVSFIRALNNNTLTHLTYIAPSLPNDLPSILAHQNSSLTSLEFRCPELWCPTFCSNVDIAILPRSLTYLSINVPRNGTWPMEYLEQIGSLSRLRSADLYMNIQSTCAQQRPKLYTSAYPAWERENAKGFCTGEEQFQRPFLGKEDAEELFTFMLDVNRRREATGSGGLTEVTFWAGDWTRGWDGPLVVDELWVEGRKAKISCKVSEDGARCSVDDGEGYWRDTDRGGVFAKDLLAEE
jgi:hypothetical protein